jgi:hypothetical protein
MYANVSSCSGGDPAVRDLHAQHLVVAALALAVDAVVQTEHPEGVLVDTAVEVLVHGALEDVELFADHRVEGASLQIADVNRHTTAPGWAGGGGEGEDGGRRRPGPSAGGGATEFVVHLVRRAAHEDGGSAVDPQNHGAQGNPGRS